MKRAALVLVLIVAAVSAAAVAYYSGLNSGGKGSAGAPGAKVLRGGRPDVGSKKSNEATVSTENSGSAEPLGNSGSSGRVEAKPVEGELIEPVKREEDFGIYRQLQDKLKFTVLYPGYMPPGAKPEGVETAFQMVNQGVNGFALRYRSEKYGAVTVMEGSVFDPMPGKEREQIKINGGTAYLETVEEGRYAAFFVQNGIRYGLAGDGMSKEEIRKIATALVPLSEMK